MLFLCRGGRLYQRSKQKDAAMTKIEANRFFTLTDAARRKMKMLRCLADECDLSGSLTPQINEIIEAITIFDRSLQTFYVNQFKKASESAITIDGVYIGCNAMRDLANTAARRIQVAVANQ
jgi:hypothetical protein